MSSPPRLTDPTQVQKPMLCALCRSESSPHPTRHHYHRSYLCAKQDHYLNIKITMSIRFVDVPMVVLRMAFTFNVKPPVGTQRLAPAKA